MQNYYQVLGLASNASPEDIKKAYRLYASKLHPDKNQGDSFFEERFKEVQQAYQVLSNPQAKALHDNMLKNYQVQGSSPTYQRWADLELREALLKQKELIWKQKEAELARKLSQKVFRRYAKILFLAIACNIVLFFAWFLEKYAKPEEPVPYNIPTPQIEKQAPSIQNRENAMFHISPEQAQQWWTTLDSTWKVAFKEAIYLAEEPQIQDLYRILNLTRIELNNKQITDLTPLKYLHKLRILHCSGNPIRSLQPLEKMLFLEELWCYNTFIESLEPLQNLYQLKRLSFNNTPIKDLKPLEKLAQLQIVNCSRTQITTLYPLQNLPNLRFVGCYENNINITELSDFETKNPLCKIMY